MSIIKSFRVFENSDVCYSCNGSGEVVKEINIFGDTDKLKCDDCDGTGKLSIQSFTKDLDRTFSDFRNELKEIFKEFEIQHSDFIKCEPNRHSDEYDDIESIGMEVEIYEPTTLNKEFLDEISVKYIDYKISIDSYRRIYLIVAKPF